jgi:hypothetical protein
MIPLNHKRGLVVGHHPERNLPPIHHRDACGDSPRNKAMTEVVTALFALLSISVFLAHAFDAYRSR